MAKLKSKFEEFFELIENIEIIIYCMFFEFLRSERNEIM